MPRGAMLRCRGEQAIGPAVPHSFEGKAGRRDERRDERHSRRLAQFVIRLPDIKDVSTDLSCDGCSVVDNRVEVVNGAVYPYSAVGQLLGQLRGSIKCVFPSVSCKLPPRDPARCAHGPGPSEAEGLEAANAPHAFVRIESLSGTWQRGPAARA